MRVVKATHDSYALVGRYGGTAEAGVVGIGPRHLAPCYAVGCGYGFAPGILSHLGWGYCISYCLNLNCKKSAARQLYTHFEPIYDPCANHGRILYPCRATWRGRPKSQAATLAMGSGSKDKKRLKVPNVSKDMFWFRWASMGFVIACV